MGIGVANPGANLEVAGGIKTWNAGKIIVDYDGINVVEQVAWDPEYVRSHVGESFIWTEQGPNLRDVQRCAAGPNASFRVISDRNWHGQYLVTFQVTPESGRPSILGQWQGWHMQLWDRNGVVVADGVGRVFFALEMIAGQWRLEHMSGTINNDNFSCY